jgi:hypothetical protein
MNLHDQFRNLHVIHFSGIAKINGRCWRNVSPEPPKIEILRFPKIQLRHRLARNQHEFARLSPKFARSLFPCNNVSKDLRVSPAPPKIETLRISLF